MVVKLYKNLSDENTINPELTGEIVLNYDLVSPCSMGNPTFRITTNVDISLYNYCYLEEFHRYYFLSTPVKYRTGVYELSGNVDALNSFWSTYNEEEAVIERQEFEYNWYLNDNMLQESNESFVQTIKLGEDFSQHIKYIAVVQG